MLRSRLVPAAVLLLLLAGCSPSLPVAAPSETPGTTSATPTASPIPVEQQALVIDVSGLTLTDSTGASASASWDEGDAVIDLIVQAVGPAPTPETTPKGDTYRWPEGITVFHTGTSVFVSVTVAEANGYALFTVDGIAVGSSRADIAALDIYAIDYDGDGDGLPDAVGLGPVEEPGTESLVEPGAVGTSYVQARFSGDVVATLQAPSGDWLDL